MLLTNPWKLVKFCLSCSRKGEHLTFWTTAKSGIPSRARPHQHKDMALRAELGTGRGGGRVLGRIKITIKSCWTPAAIDMALVTELVRHLGPESFLPIHFLSGAVIEAASPKLPACLR